MLLWTRYERDMLSDTSASLVCLPYFVFLKVA